MIPRPSFRLPLWSVPILVAALYAGRSLIRGSWRPEMPMDALILVMVVVVMAVVARLRALPLDADGDDSTSGASPDDEEGPAS